MREERDERSEDGERRGSRREEREKQNVACSLVGSIVESSYWTMMKEKHTNAPFI